MTLDQIQQYAVNLLIYGGGGGVVFIGIPYLVFQFFGKRWIESKFERSLEQYRFHQAQEIAKLRIEIESMLSGVLKIQEKEFEILPEAWRKLNEAYGYVVDLVSPLQRSENLDNKTPQQLEEFFSKSELSESQKDDIRVSKQRSIKYQELIFWHRFSVVEKACIELNNYIALYSIFFPTELKEKFSKASRELYAVLTLKSRNENALNADFQIEGYRKMRDEIGPLYKSIEDEIQARLHSHGRIS